jgi:hypothetical protein
MLRLISQGDYKLMDNSDINQILLLNDVKAYSITSTLDGVEIVATTFNKQRQSQVQAGGKYRLYEVDEETGLSSAHHLELEIGNGHWRCYLLPDGLPISRSRGAKIARTEEIITRTNQLAKMLEDVDYF